MPVPRLNVIGEIFVPVFHKNTPLKAFCIEKLIAENLWSIPGFATRKEGDTKSWLAKLNPHIAMVVSAILMPVCKENFMIVSTIIKGLCFYGTKLLSVDMTYQ